MSETTGASRSDWTHRQGADALHQLGRPPLGGPAAGALGSCRCHVAATE